MCLLRGTDWIFIYNLATSNTVHTNTTFQLCTFVFIFCYMFRPYILTTIRCTEDKALQKRPSLYSRSAKCIKYHSQKSSNKMEQCNMKVSPSVPVFFPLLDNVQYVWPKHVVQNKNERIELICCVCVNCICW